MSDVKVNQVGIEWSEDVENVGTGREIEEDGQRDVSDDTYKLNNTKVSEMKVIELKKALRDRGVKCSGNKNVLVERLKAILLLENSRLEDETDLSDDEDNVDACMKSKVHEGMTSSSLHKLLTASKVRKEFISFRDVEESLCSFSGDDKTQNVEMWVSDFEDMSKLCDWGDTQKIIYARRLLQGSAKLFVSYERCFGSWNQLKNALISEFRIKASSKEIHKQLASRRKMPSESYHEYLYKMIDIASQANVDLESVFRYIIDGIAEDNNKIILYGATTVSEFRKKLALFEEATSKTQQRRHCINERKVEVKERQPTNFPKPRDSQSQRRCYNCGSRQHSIESCPDKAKGPKCFNCNLYGHLAANCTQNKSTLKVDQVDGNNLLSSKIIISVLMNDIDYQAVLDSGSDLSVMNNTTYIEIGAPKLSKGTRFTGIGGNAMTSMGGFDCKINIDNESYTIFFHVVPDNLISPHAMILGLQLFRIAKVTITNKTVKIERTEESSLLSILLVDNSDPDEVLVKRLQEALDKENGGRGEHSEEDSQDNKNTDDFNESELDTTKTSELPSSDSNNQDEETLTESQYNKENDIDRIEEETSDGHCQEQTNCEEPSNDNEEPDEEENQDNSNSEKLEENQYSDKEMQDNTDEQHDIENSEESHQQDQEMSDTIKEENALEDEDMNHPEDEYENSKVNLKQEPHDSGYHEVSTMDDMQNRQDKEKEKDGYEVNVKTEPYDGNDLKHMKSESEIKTERDSYREDRKRKRSPSLSPYKSRQQSPQRQREEEPEFNDNDVILSWYDSDLNLTIDRETFCTATPLTQGGFGFIWAGARGTFGYTSGKLCYQVKLVEYINVSHLENEPNPNVLRVGWSTFDTSMQLGEEPLSFGYGGTGKISVDCQFTNYGKEFDEGDVVTAYLEFEGEDFIISYSVNDEFLGEAWKIPIEELQGKALAPHILTKNVKYAVNFGQCEPWVKTEEDFTFLKDFPIEYAEAGPKRPEKISDCEIIMMCGLPACGKTTWANKYASEHPEMHYNIIGTNALIEKMKVMGLPRKANYRGRWDLLIDKCTKCLNKLIDIGAYRRRHYILDQTNVYPAAQRRKMRKFEGFTRKAVVIVPTDEEFKARTQKQAQKEKKDVPENAVMEMKANFVLPDKSLFSEIIYSELDENEARSLVHKYNKEAAAAGFPERKGPISGGGGRSGGPNVKRFRGDFGHGGQHGHQQHHGGGGGGGGGGQRHDGFRRGPPPFRNFSRAMSHDHLYRGRPRKEAGYSSG